MNPATLATATGITPELAKTWADLLSAAMLRAQCFSPARQAMFLAQVGHESGGFATLVESLNYTPQALLATWPSRFTRATADLYGRTATQQAKQLQIGIAAYGGRLGNAASPSHDGYTYRGRGLIQVTGKSNYARVGATLNLDLIAHPELLEQPQHAATSAAVYWLQNGLNTYADRKDLVACSGYINTGSAARPEHEINGMADRRARYERACGALGV